MRGGAAGILFGRAIFGADNPLAVLRACRAIIHDDATVKTAAALAGL
jgi:DhnA family fructose-bisphosphate aldolase class Ia